MWYGLTLECGHKVQTDTDIRIQYEDDTHWVRCPVGTHDLSNWIKVLDIKELSNEEVHNVPSKSTLVMSRSILRLQPSAPKQRRNPYVYRRNPRKGI